jgi:hypothetical protein
MSVRVKIRRDSCGTWSVHGLSPVAVAHLPSLSASLDFARRECAASPATIELLIDGFYAVVHQEDGWPRPPVACEAEGSRRGDPGTEIGGRLIGYSDAASLARSRSSWFIDWRACATRLIVALASGFVAMKRSKSAFLSTSSRQ